MKFPNVTIPLIGTVKFSATATVEVKTPGYTNVTLSARGSIETDRLQLPFLPPGLLAKFSLTAQIGGTLKFQKGSTSPTGKITWTMTGKVALGNEIGVDGGVKFFAEAGAAIGLSGDLYPDFEKPSGFIYFFARAGCEWSWGTSKVKKSWELRGGLNLNLDPE